MGYWTKGCPKDGKAITTPHKRVSVKTAFVIPAKNMPE